MASHPKAHKAARGRAGRPELPPELRIGEAFARLARENALQTLVRGALPAHWLKRMLREGLPREATREMPDEIWASLAAGFAYENPPFGLALAESLHERLAWDREPATMDDWWTLVRERPLEALWMAALSEDRQVRKEFAHIAEHCIDNHRASPECKPPSWEFLEGVLELHARTARELREAEKTAEAAERRYQGERERLEELREELKRLRRETSELRTEKAQAARRAEELASRARQELAVENARRAEDLERRLRKAEKEREHLLRRLDRATDSEAPPEAPPPSAGEASPGAEALAETVEAASSHLTIAEDPNPRRRVLRQMLRKLFKKGKIGASHTHEDNVYRGVADHEKGVAKTAMDLLYREGLLLPKPTATDPHVSLNPERTAEVQAIISGRVENPRLQHFFED